MNESQWTVKHHLGHRTRWFCHANVSSPLYWCRKVTAPCSQSSHQLHLHAVIAHAAAAGHSMIWIVHRLVSSCVHVNGQWCVYRMAFQLKQRYTFERRRRRRRVGQLSRNCCQCQFQHSLMPHVDSDFVHEWNCIGRMTRGLIYHLSLACRSVDDTKKN